MDFDLLLGIDWCIASKATFDFSKNKINTTNGTVNTFESDIFKQKIIIDTILSSDSKLKKLYEQLFFKEVSLPNPREHDCKIIIKDGESLKTRPNKQFWINELTYIKKYLDDNIQKDFVRQTTSPRALPILLVPRKNGELRLCVDFPTTKQNSGEGTKYLPGHKYNCVVVIQQKNFFKIRFEKRIQSITYAQGVTRANSFCDPIRQLLIHRDALWIMQCSCNLLKIHHGYSKSHPWIKLSSLFGRYIRR
jgi:hypothetical protein